MGLDTTHEAWTGPYSSFMEWRIWLAKQIGINLLEMEGFGSRNYEDDKSKRIRGTISWNTISDDLKILLNDSDCEGSISPKNCKKIADRLDEILKQEETYENRYFMIKTKTFREGCLKAFKNKEKMKFQ